MARGAGVMSGAVALAFVTVHPASAVFISNKDTKSYSLIIDERGKKSTHEIAAGGVLEGACLEGCILTLSGVEDGLYTLPEGREIVTIEEGVVYYEGRSDKPAKDDAKSQNDGGKPKGKPR
ncbi:MAG: hypothetical protein K0U74_09520 [Alphaproteobacteria bacterium]|nr:hypothetical protein [Alphaproteobacteria bacterium]